MRTRKVFFCVLAAVCITFFLAVTAWSGSKVKSIDITLEEEPIYWYERGVKKKAWMATDEVAVFPAKTKEVHLDETRLVSQFHPQAVSFQSVQGAQPHPDPAQIIHEWNYTGHDVPEQEDDLFVHINLWLLNGAPANGHETEMVIRSFSWRCVGDINGDGNVDLADAITALKVAAGMDVSGLISSDYATSGADVNRDARIGLEEIIYILQKLSRRR